MTDWKVEIGVQAERQLNELDYLEAAALRRYLVREIATRPDPCSVGGEMGELWLYEPQGAKIAVEILWERRVIMVAEVRKA
jgi:hypothetical protein